jgi:REP element-mobilizing transposase RayT
MEYDELFALHITWTCYGTRLPGDKRSYVSNTLLPKRGYVPKQNIPGTPYSVNNRYAKTQAAALQKWPTVLLTADQAVAAAQSLVEAAGKRGWRILRGTVMANHIHVVVTDCPADGEAVRRVLKGNSQAALSKRQGRCRKWWTQGGSDRYKHGQDAIEAAIRYVADQPNMLAAIIDMRVFAIAR